jgi:hypothetical protein
MRNVSKENIFNQHGVGRVGNMIISKEKNLNSILGVAHLKNSPNPKKDECCAD